ncbi:glycosyltransferase family protein [Paenirhodobacter populi]|uniref:glycosyltransferase family protein n=1 Tax=Paenirhodobacter populi TaxID=2306993 RepID=UPI000FE2C7D4|nr:glycosyltransferase [Sinirhodobacter populi]RWR05827.1 glycosyltransferase [Sinirhodobacter populi]
MSASGEITQLTPYHLSGWIAASDEAEPSLEVLVNGTPIGFANVTRLQSQSRWSFRYRFCPPLSGLRQVVRVRDKITGRFVMPRGLPGLRGNVSGLMRRHSRIEGWIDMIDAGAVRGWVIDNDAIGTPPVPRLLIDGAYVEVQPTRYARLDLAANGYGSAALGFDFDLRPLRLLPGTHHIRVTADGRDLRRVAGLGAKVKVDAILSVSGSLSAVATAPQTRRPAVHKPPVVITARKGTLLASGLDKADRSQVGGWAIEAAAEGQATKVDICANGVVLKTAIAGLERRDLLKPFPASRGIAGFVYHPTVGMTLTGPATVSVRHSASHEELSHSPKKSCIGRTGTVLDDASVRRRRAEAARAAAVPLLPAAAVVGPKVAAIILNRNGAHFLEALFESVALHNTYENLELVVIDHGSNDRSRIVCRRWAERLNVRFLARGRNYSYSASNNWGVAQTDCEIVFLLNNDVVFDGDLVREALPYLDGEIGMVGFKLASPPTQSRLAAGETRNDLLDVGYELQQVQHLGVRFTTGVTDRPFMPFEVPVNRDNASFADRPSEVAGVTAAALMVRRSDFEAVGGLHEEYFYGFEDVDFCVTFRALTGKKIVCLNHIRAFHHRSASLERASQAEMQRKATNRRVLERRMGRHILNTLKHERITNQPFLREDVVRIGFAVSEVSDKTPAGDYFTALELARELSRRHGYECVFLAREDWYELQDVDVIVAMVDGFRPSQIKAARADIVTVLWMRNWFERWINLAEMNQFDAIWASSQMAADAFTTKFSRPIEVVRIASATDRMQGGIETQELASDVCFTGSYFGSPRQISKALDPIAIEPWKVAIFGHGWEAFAPFAPYLRGPKGYSEMPDIYASTKIVIDDANITTLEWGSVNSRVFDALAAGALVITNSRTASDDGFDGLLPVYTDRDDLTAKIRYFLQNPKERNALVAQLQALVREEHSYAVRADQVSVALGRLFAARRIAIHFTAPRVQTAIAGVIEAAFRDAGLLAHVVSGDSGLPRAWRNSAEIALHVTGLTDFSVNHEALRPDCANVLLITCPADALRQRDLTLFDLAITLRPEVEAFCASAGLACFTLPAFTPAESGEVAASMALRDYLAAHLPGHIDTLIERLAPALDAPPAPKASNGPSLWMTKTAEAPPLRLAYVLWDWPALSQTFVLNELRWLVENGQDVCVYYKADPDKLATLDFEIAAYRVEDAEELAVLLRAHDRTMIHTHFAYPAAANLAFPAAQATGLPFTVTPAGVDIFHYDNMKRNRLKEMASSDLCRAVFTLGSFHEKFFIEQGVPPEKIVIERQAVSELPQPEPVAGPSVGTRPKIISFSRFVEKKGYRYMVEAAACMPECDFVLYGYGPQEGELRRLVQERGLANFTFGGALVGVDAIATVCAEACVFVLPCVRAENGDMDGLPTVLLEAMMLEVPVVSTMLVNIPDLITDGVTGFLAAPGDVPGLVDKLREAVALPPIRRQCILASARRKAAGFGSTERTMSTLMRVWQGKAVDIVLVTYDRGFYRNWVETRQILDRIYRHTTPPFTVTVVDNGSEPAFLNHLEEAFGRHDNFRLIPLNENRWCGPATNIGFAQGNSDYIIYLCSKEGYVLRRGWERDMVRWMEKNPEVALGGHRVTVPKFNTGKSYLDHPLFDKFRNPTFAAENPDRPFDHVQGGIYIYRRSVFDRIGGFSEAVPQDSTDIEFSYYLESCGEKLGEIPGIRAGTIKTLPGIAAMADEDMIAAHPLNRRTIGRFERIVLGRIRTCNICDWEGEAFAADSSDAARCPGCGSQRFGRSAMHLLSLDSTLQHRPRIRVIADETALADYLRRISPDTWQEPAKDEVIASLSAIDTDLAIVDAGKIATDSAGTAALVKFVGAGGRLVLRADETAAFAAAGLTGTPVTYNSAVFAFDWRPIMSFGVSVVQDELHFLGECREDIPCETEANVTFDSAVSVSR